MSAFSSTRQPPAGSGRTWTSGTTVWAGSPPKPAPGRGVSPLSSAIISFSVKNPDVSVAMGNDKARHVVETGAEYVVAGDNSCLAHIAGLLHRGRTGVKTIHLAEVLASTEQDPA